MTEEKKNAEVYRRELDYQRLPAGRYMQKARKMLAISSSQNKGGNLKTMYPLYTQGKR